jgi:hypothetical protein
LHRQTSQEQATHASPPAPHPEQLRHTERPGREIASDIRQQTPASEPRARFASDAEAYQPVKPPAVPTRLSPEQDSPRDAADPAPVNAMQPISQPHGMARDARQDEARSTFASPAAMAPAPRPEAPSWPGVLRPQPPAEPTRTSRARDAAQPVIRVTIGRVEVKANMPPPPPPRARSTPRKPALSLSAYLQQRREGRS